MPIQKSLKYHTSSNGHGYIHRTHRSKKGRKHKGRQYLFSLDRKRKLEELRINDLDI